MNIRDAMNSLSAADLRQIHVDNSFVVEISYHKENKKPYRVKLADCRVIECKGHDRIDQLDSMVKALKPPASGYRIRRYGEFGSTIN